MISEHERQAVVDQEHLKILAFAHAIDGLVYAFFSLFGLFYAAMGGVMGLAFARAPQQSDQLLAALFTLFFVVMGGGLFLLFVLVASLKLLCAHRLWVRRSRVFCFVVAALSCFAMPHGTAIGIWTIVVLARPSVALLFSGPNQGPGSPDPARDAASHHLGDAT